eukprot:SAG22_NODE_130_length_18670_cov_12.091379_11_plen_209_part_00
MVKVDAMAAKPAAGGARAPLQAIFFDFDSTISMPYVVERLGDWAVADRQNNFDAMTAAEVKRLFGPPQRVAAFAQLLSALITKGVALFVVSLGLMTAIKPALAPVGLLEHFCMVWGQDSPELSAVDCVKGALIQQVMASGGPGAAARRAETAWSKEQVLFLDDTMDHIENARAICGVHHVDGNGMSAADLDAIRRAAGLPLAQAAAGW